MSARSPTLGLGEDRAKTAAAQSAFGAVPALRAAADPGTWGATLEHVSARALPWLVATGCAAAGYYAWEHNRVRFDDAFITYRYAENLVAGHGAVFNVGERVEGYTNFAWMLLAAAGLRLGLDPFATTRSVGVASHVLMLAVVGWCFCRLLLVPPAEASHPGPVARWGRLALLPVLFVLVLPDSFAAMAGSGLESSFVAALWTASGALMAFGDFERRTTRVAVVAVLTLAMLTRLDCAVATLAAGVTIAYSASRDGQRPAAALRTAVAWLWPVGAVLAIWSVGRHAYYGELLPNTYYAKAADHLHVDAGWHYLRAYASAQPQVLPLLVLVPAGLLSPRRAVRRLTVFSMVALLGEAALTIKVGGDFMEYRFAWQQYGLLVMAATGAIVAVADRSLASGLSVIAAALSVCGAVNQLDQSFTMQSLEEMNRYARVGMDVGKRLREALPPQTVLATTLVGTLGYYSKLTIVDQWGLTDTFVAHQPWPGPPLARGHVKFAPLDYLRRRGVDLYIAHPAICSCKHPCREDKPNVFVRIDADRCMRSWYLTQTPELTEHVCEHPEDFVLNRVSCPGDAPATAAAAAPDDTSVN